MLGSSSGHLSRLKYHWLHPLSPVWSVTGDPRSSLLLPWEGDSLTVKRACRCEQAHALLGPGSPGFPKVHRKRHVSFPDLCPTLSPTVLSVVCSPWGWAAGLRGQDGLNNKPASLKSLQWILLPASSWKAQRQTWRSSTSEHPSPICAPFPRVPHCLSDSLKPILKNGKDFLTELPTGSKGV